MENEQKLVLFAEETKVDLERSDIFLMVSFKLFDNTVNRNKQGVTSAFISSIINNEEKYTALPLYADVDALLDRKYNALGHRLDPKTGEFGTSQIGSLVDFQMRADNDGVVSLLGTARIPKRDAEICERIMELYELGNLNVSFEIKYSPDKTVEINGVSFVDAADENVLTGMAVVWTPAYADANALDMVAEANADSEIDRVEAENASNEGDEKEMPNENEAVVSEELMQAEVEQVEAEKAEPEVEVASEPEEQQEAVVAEEQQAELIHQEVETIDRVEQCGDDDPIHVVEKREVVVETVEPDEKERMIEELRAQIAELNKQIAELNVVKAEYDKMVAEAKRIETESKMAKMKNFAEKHGLDTESEEVKNAIAELNYEALMNMTEDQKEPETTVQVASYVIKTNMEINSEYGGLLERRN